MPRKVLMPAALLVPALPQPSRRTPARDALIRAQALDVLVNALVTDRRNGLLPDLKAEDFRVHEDGIEQKIVYFRFASAQCRFRNGDNLIFYFDIYNPTALSERKVDVTMKVWLMRDGGG